MSVYDNLLGIAQISIKGDDNQKAITEKLLDEFNFSTSELSMHLSCQEEKLEDL